jgi:hypothetical protein
VTFHPSVLLAAARAHDCDADHLRGLLRHGCGRRGTDLRRGLRGGAGPGWRWHPEVAGERQVVVLAVQEAAGQGVVLAHQLAVAGGGLPGPDQGGGAVCISPGGEGCGASASPALGDGGLADQCLYRGAGLGGLGGPAPSACGGGVGFAVLK